MIIKTTLTLWRQLRLGGATWFECLLQMWAPLWISLWYPGSRQDTARLKYSILLFQPEKLDPAHGRRQGEKNCSIACTMIIKWWILFSVELHPPDGIFCPRCWFFRFRFRSITSIVKRFKKITHNCLNPPLEVPNHKKDHYLVFCN